MTADTLRRYTNSLLALVSLSIQGVRSHYKDRPNPQCYGDEIIKAAAVACDNCARAVQGAMVLE